MYSRQKRSLDHGYLKSMCQFLQIVAFRATAHALVNEAGRSHFYAKGIGVLTRYMSETPGIREVCWQGVGLCHSRK